MERKIWLKPQDGGKANEIKNISERSGQPALLECLFLDTADADLAQSNMVLAICAGADGLWQLAAIDNAGAADEYTAELPPEGLALSLFPQEVSEGLRQVIQDKPLIICFATVFEEKIRLISPGEGQQYQLVRLLGKFENDDLKGELCAIELKGEGALAQNAGEYAAQLAAETKLERSAPPWFEVLRIKASGFRPAMPEKELRRASESRIMRAALLQLPELVRAYVAVGAGAFDRTTVHMLRIEARRMMSLLEVFEAFFGEKTAQYTEYLQKLLDDTDEMRHTDILDDEVGLICALNPRLDFSALQQKLAEKRAAFREQRAAGYARGEYSGELLAMWIDIHTLAKNMPEDEGGKIVSALEKVRAWAAELGAFKKSGISDPEKVHACRVLVRKVRYALENMEAMIPRRAFKAAEVLKKIQDELGILCDAYQHIELLHSMAAESGEAEFAFGCGICAGIFTSFQQEIQREAAGVWRDYRSDIRSLEELL